MRTNARHLVTEKVLHELHDRHRSIAWLAERSGIDRVELGAKLRAEEDLTMVDLAGIALALDLPIASLVPSLPHAEE